MGACSLSCTLIGACGWWRVAFAIKEGWCIQNTGKDTLGLACTRRLITGPAGMLLLLKGPMLLRLLCIRGCEPQAGLFFETKNVAQELAPSLRPCSTSLRMEGSSLGLELSPG